MDAEFRLPRHFLGALAYRTQKALRDRPPGFGEFQGPERVRTPTALVRHMTSVLGYARTFFVGGKYWPEPLPSLDDEIPRFHQMVEDVGRHLEMETPLRGGMSPSRLLQGPFADAMTHAGQLAILRRLAGSPVPPENFIVADITADRLGAGQATPVSPDAVWPEAPEDWIPPSPQPGEGREGRDGTTSRCTRRPALRVLSGAGDSNRREPRPKRMVGRTNTRSRDRRTS